MVCVLLLHATSCKKEKDIKLEPLTDIDGNVYKTVKIGNQVWMAENLRVTHYNTGTGKADEIPLLSDGNAWSTTNAGAYCYYDNNSANKEKYGLFYNYYAVNTGNLAPKGWHVASDADWEQLTSYLVKNGYNYDESNTVDNHVAKSLTSTTGWVLSNVVGAVGNDATTNNKTGFNALPAGTRFPDASFAPEGFAFMVWTSGPSNPNTPNFCRIDYKSVGLEIISHQASYGHYVRCVKDSN